MKKVVNFLSIDRFTTVEFALICALCFVGLMYAATRWEQSKDKKAQLIRCVQMSEGSDSACDSCDFVVYGKYLDD